VDDRAVTEEALSANFLMPPDENACSGKTLAELCRDSLNEFNPMVRVSVEKGLVCLSHKLLLVFIVL
jgi:ubiquitin-like 1-activating enzyme E1 A